MFYLFTYLFYCTPNKILFISFVLGFNEEISKLGQLAVLITKWIDKYVVVVFNLFFGGGGLGFAALTSNPWTATLTCSRSKKHEQNPIKAGGKMFLLPHHSGRDHSINGPPCLFFSLSHPHEHSYSTLPPCELWMEGPLVFLLLAGPVSTQCTLLYMNTSHLNTEQNGLE